jgi:hypothetical protein
MPEPSMEFIGQRLKAIQDEQWSMRSDVRTITSRLDRMLDRMDMMLELSETRFDRLEKLINEKVK